MNSEDTTPVPLFITTPIHILDNNQNLSSSSQMSLPSTSNSVIVSSVAENTLIIPTLFQNKITTNTTPGQGTDGNINILPNSIILQNPAYQPSIQIKNTPGQLAPVMLTGKIGNVHIGPTVLNWVRYLQHLFERNPEWNTKKKLQTARDATNPSQGSAFYLTQRAFEDWPEMKKYVATMLNGTTIDAYMIALQLGALRWCVESETFEAYADRFVGAVERILKEEVHDIPDLLSGAKWQILANIPSIKFQAEIHVGVPGLVKQGCNELSDLRLYAEILKTTIKSSEAPLIKWYLNNK